MSNLGTDPAAVRALARGVAKKFGIKPKEVTGLRAALAGCITAAAKIAPEQARLTAAIDASKNKAEIEALEYQRDWVAWQLGQASTVGLWRLKHLNTLTSKEAWDE